ncbi:MAG TPA: hypothetical protein VLS93_09510 [Anaeromyxobacteraceae bacterium]|nr:hypothetical protein [Anaeromyxobacteraceae bacterium]
MSKRLQVLLDERDFREIGRLARQRRMSVAEWVRDALRAARRGEPRTDPEAKLKAIRSAARNAFPTADMDRMLAEISRGYGDLP